MTEKYMFFNSTANDRRRNQASDMADYWNSFLRTGLINEGTNLGLQVVADNTMNISIEIGRALIGGHLYINDDSLVKSVEGAHATLNRIDRVVLRYDNSIENRHIKAFVVKGEPSENPVPPQLTRDGDIYELSLAQIRVVAGKSYVEQSDIVDERLDESVCGLASSLVSVPTDVYNERFSEYMQQIANEWQSWFNSVEDASYITGATFTQRNRDVDRQLANLNAIADIDNRAIGNTGKFYDLFDGTNDMSIAKMDTNYAFLTSDSPANSSTIEVSDNNFSIGDEIHIIGVTSQLDSELTLITRKITNKQDGTLTVDSAIPNPFMKDTNILRSTFKNNRKIDSIGLSDWSTLNTVGLGTTYNSNVIKENQDGTMIFYDGVIYGVGNDGTLTKIIEASNRSSSCIFAITDDFKFMVKVVAETMNSVTTGKVSMFQCDYDNKTLILLSSSPYSLSTYNTFPVEIFYIDNDIYVFTGTNAWNGGATRYLLKFNIETKVFSVSGSTLYTQGGDVYYYDSTTRSIYYTVVSNSGGYYTLSLRRIILDENNAMKSNIEMIPIDGNNDPIKTDISTSASSVDVGLLLRRHEKTGKFIISLGGTTAYLLNTYDMTFTKLTFDTPTLSGIALSQDMSMALSKAGVYILKNGIYTLIKYIGGNSSYTPIVINRVVAITCNSNNNSNAIASYSPTVKNFPLNFQCAYYKFKKPIKSLAGWLLTNTPVTSVQAELSLVNANEPESYKALEVTQNDNEYEFMQVANIYEKNKATLKLTIEGTADLEKLLGAVE